MILWSRLRRALGSGSQRIEHPEVRDALFKIPWEWGNACHGVSKCLGHELIVIGRGYVDNFGLSRLPGDLHGKLTTRPGAEGPPSLTIRPPRPRNS